MGGGEKTAKAGKRTKIQELVTIEQAAPAPVPTTLVVANLQGSLQDSTSIPVQPQKQGMQISKNVTAEDRQQGLVDIPPPPGRHFMGD